MDAQKKNELKDMFLNFGCGAALVVAFAAPTISQVIAKKEVTNGCPGGTTSVTNSTPTILPVQLATCKKALEPK